MGIRIQVEGFEEIFEFPDGTSDEVMGKFIRGETEKTKSIESKGFIPAISGLEVAGKGLSAIGLESIGEPVRETGFKVRAALGRGAGEATKIAVGTGRTLGDILSFGTPFVSQEERLASAQAVKEGGEPDEALGASAFNLGLAEVAGGLGFDKTRANIRKREFAKEPRRRELLEKVKVPELDVRIGSRAIQAVDEYITAQGFKSDEAMPESTAGAVALGIIEFVPQIVPFMVSGGATASATVKGLLRTMTKSMGAKNSSKVLGLVKRSAERAIGGAAGGAVLGAVAAPGFEGERTRGELMVEFAAGFAIAETGLGALGDIFKGLARGFGKLKLNKADVFQSELNAERLAKGEITIDEAIKGLNEIADRNDLTVTKEGITRTDADGNQLELPFPKPKEVRVSEEGQIGLPGVEAKEGERVMTIDEIDAARDRIGRPVEETDIAKPEGEVPVITSEEIFGVTEAEFFAKAKAAGIPEGTARSAGVSKIKAEMKSAGFDKAEIDKVVGRFENEFDKAQFAELEKLIAKPKEAEVADTKASRKSTESTKTEAEAGVTGEGKPVTLPREKEAKASAKAEVPAEEKLKVPEAEAEARRPAKVDTEAGRAEGRPSELVPKVEVKGEPQAKGFAPSPGPEPRSPKQILDEMDALFRSQGPEVRETPKFKELDAELKAADIEFKGGEAARRVAAKDKSIRTVATRTAELTETRFNGVQQGSKQTGDFLLFTDSVTGSTFATKTADVREVRTRRNEVRAEFAKANEFNSRPVHPVNATIREMNEAIGTPEADTVISKFIDMARVRNREVPVQEQLDLVIQDSVRKKVIDSQRQGITQNERAALREEAKENGDTLKRIAKERGLEGADAKIDKTLDIDVTKQDATVRRFIEFTNPDAGRVTVDSLFDNYMKLDKTARDKFYTEAIKDEEFFGGVQKRRAKEWDNRDVDFEEMDAFGIFEKEVFPIEEQFYSDLDYIDSFGPKSEHKDILEILSEEGAVDIKKLRPTLTAKFKDWWRTTDDISEAMFIFPDGSMTDHNLTESGLSKFEGGFSWIEHTHISSEFLKTTGLKLRGSRLSMFGQITGAIRKAGTEGYHMYEMFVKPTKLQIAKIKNAAIKADGNTVIDVSDSNRSHIDSFIIEDRSDINKLDGFLKSIFFDDTGAIDPAKVRGRKGFETKIDPAIIDRLRSIIAETMNKGGSKDSVRLGIEEKFPSLIKKFDKLWDEGKGIYRKETERADFLEDFGDPNKPAVRDMKLNKDGTVENIESKLTSDAELKMLQSVEKDIKQRPLTPQLFIFREFDKINGTDTASIYLDFLARDKKRKVESDAIKSQLKVLMKQKDVSNMRLKAFTAVRDDPAARQNIESRGVKIPERLTPGEQLTDAYGRRHYDQMYANLNQVRKLIGEEPIPYRFDYVTFARVDEYFNAAGTDMIRAKWSMWRDALLSINESAVKSANPKAEAIRAAKELEDARRLTGPNRHYKSTFFPHLKRQKLAEKPISLDYAKDFSTYLERAKKYEHLGPLVAKIREMTGDWTTGFHKKGTPQKFKLRDTAPNFSDQLGRFADNLTGASNRSQIGDVKIPRSVDKVIEGLTRNVAVATLGGSVRAALIQGSANLLTATMIGPKAVGNGMKMWFDPKWRAFAMRESNHLPNRTPDVVVDDLAASIMNTNPQGFAGKGAKAFKRSQELSFYMLQTHDLATAQMGWLGSYHKARAEGLNHKQSVRFADEVIVSTHADASKGGRSALQRTPLGRSLTLFQTFNLNEFAFITREVLTTKNMTIAGRRPSDISQKEANGERLRRITTLIMGTMAFNTFFEEVIGINTPLPSPIRSMINALLRDEGVAQGAFDAGLSVLSQLPIVGSSFEFGSAPIGGAAAAVLDDLTDITSSKKGPTQPLAVVGGKLTGVAGTNQLKKSVRAYQNGGNPFDVFVGTWHGHRRFLLEMLGGAIGTLFSKEEERETKKERRF